MNNKAHFAYVQARLQARHGARPNEGEWRRLHSIGDLGNYLQVAQRGPLNNWVVGMNASTDVHDIELTLRQRFRSYIDELSQWLGNDWRSAIIWTKRLVDLPALNYLISGQAINNWMLDDPELKAFAHVNESLRAEAFMASDCEVFLQAWKNQQRLTDAWFQEFQKRCPHNISKQSGLMHVWKAIANRLQAQCEAPNDNTAIARESLEAELIAGFRKYSNSPAAFFIHLALTALDLEKLRGGLVHRSLFPEYEGEQR
jgi:hypothetical protein